MKSSLFVFCGLLFLVSFVGCKQNPTTPSVSGLYNYTAFDSSGKALVNGSMSVNVDDPAHVTGSWSLDTIDTPHNIGPQSGRGTLTGTYKAGVLSANLNPGFADNNVFLVGTFDGKNSFTGTWQWISFPGVTGGGTFTAKALLPE